jgi:hypothetical protein
MYGYGNREITWSRPVPVSEPNTGVMINAEFPLKKEMEGLEVFPHDSGIRNVNWQYQGPWVESYDPIRDVPDWKHKLYGNYETAADLKRPTYRKDFMDAKYRDLGKERDHKGVLGEESAARKRMTLEVMDDSEIGEFWSNPNAVMGDRLD